MKRWTLILISLALNFALAAVLLWPGKNSPASASVPAAGPLVARLVASNVSAGVAAPPEPAFAWSQVAAEDLRVYRDRLRAIGCPEPTVREIIRIVINESLGSRRREILAGFQGAYWDLVLRGELNRRQLLPRTEWGQALTSLAAEREQLITDVLGPDPAALAAEQRSRHAHWEQQYAWLPPEKRDRMAGLAEHYQDQLEAWTAALNARDDRNPTAADEVERQKIQQEFEDAEKQVLSPEELAESNLRESNVADWAGSLPGFQPTDDEWRTLTDLRSQWEEAQRALADPQLDDQQRATQRSEMESNFTAAVQGVLEPDRFAQYQLANNDQYQALHSVTQRYGLPDSVAAEGETIAESAQAAAVQVRANANLSPGDQQAALNAIQQETEQTLGQILGGNVLATYKEYGGDWLSGFGAAPGP